MNQIQVFLHKSLLAIVVKINLKQINILVTLKSKTWTIKIIHLIIIKKLNNKIWLESVDQIKIIFKINSFYQLEKIINKEKAQIKKIPQKKK